MARDHRGSLVRAKGAETILDNNLELMKSVCEAAAADLDCFHVEGGQARRSGRAVMGEARSQRSGGMKNLRIPPSI